MSAHGIHLETEPSADDIAALGAGLTAHSLPHAGAVGFVPLAVFARDADSALVGGISAKINWTWLQVDLVWVSEKLRKQGLGSKMLAAIETAACERGCMHAHLDTFSYQARPFYERFGYRLFAELEDYPPGHKRFFLRKELING